MNTKLFFGIIGLVLILGIAGGIIANKGTNSSKPGQYDALAMHLKTVGAKFYGAFWCPHCQAQKKAFGSSVKLLPYVECSTADGSGQLQICKDEKIASYPTWKFTNPITINENLRAVCDIYKENTPSNDPICEKTASPYSKVWVFEKETIGMDVEPAKNADGSYTIPPFSRITGEIPPETLAKWTGFDLGTPTNATSTAK
ncbi:MAG: hypothetical protein WCO58_02820 [bacterium]